MRKIRGSRILRRLAAVGLFAGASCLPAQDTALPEAKTLLEHFTEVTGGRSAYESVKTQMIRGTMSMQQANLNGQMLAYIGQGGKQYVAVDLPGAGKFETGSDGKIGWERSAMTGTRIVPRSQLGGGLTGPSVDVMASLDKYFSSIRTTGKEEAGGAPCYMVALTPSAVASQAAQDRTGETLNSDIRMCFDVTSGYLTKLSTTAKTQMGEMPIDLLMSDYRQEGPLKVAHHMQTKMSGVPVEVNLEEIKFNSELPATAFVLPEDVQALVAKKTAAVKALDEDKTAPAMKRKAK